MKKIAIIGATGSIGRQAIDVIERYPDAFRVTMISAHSDKDGLISLANRLKVPTVCYTGESSLDITDFNYPCTLFCGENALVDGAESADYDIFLNAVVGLPALRPTMVAIKKGARIALSNKEMLVSAGEYVMAVARKLKSEIIPVDSEHSAIFQCLSAGKREDVDKLIITSSGGAFRDIPLAMLDDLSPERALAHPNWNMGKKITIDCATMVNKGFEVIEASRLFDIDIQSIETVIHRESIVHSMVRFKDGAVVAQLSEPDMRLPIQYAFTYPERLPSPVKPLTVPCDLSFRAVDFERYPCFKIMLEAGALGGLYPAAMLAADSVLVPAYLSGQIKYSQMPIVMSEVLASFSLKGMYDIDDVLRINAEVEKYTHRVVKNLCRI